MSQNLEYLPEHTEAGITVRVDRTHVFITIRPDWRTILAASGGPLFSWLIAAGAFFYCWGKGSWSQWIVVPGIMTLLAAFTTAALAIRLVLPITLELTEQLQIRWRTLRAVNLLVWPRLNIRGITIERLQSRNQFFRHLWLVLHLADRGNVGVLSASRPQLECIARILREALSIPEGGHPALALAAPRKCRFKREPWAGGIRLIVRPRNIAWLNALFGLMALAGGGVVFEILNQKSIAQDHALYWVGVLGFAAMSAAGVFLINHKSYMGARKTTSIFASWEVLNVVQTSFLQPFNHQWPAPQISDIRCVRDPQRSAALEIVPNEAMPLTILVGERIEDLEWTAEVLRRALCIPPRSQESVTDKATPKPPA